MALLIRDDERRREMGQAARRRAAEFSWQKVSERTLELYDSVCAEHPALGPPRIDFGTIEQLLEKLEPDSRRIVMSALNRETSYESEHLRTQRRQQ